MDLINILKLRVNSLPDGSYTQGLKSVVKHIEAAFRHLQRGQTTADDSAFTDAIYRTNQAFEGSLKEAYRVLVNKNPAGVRPFDIEEHLQKHNILRTRVLAQLSNYRQEWRNPSTHDYLLDFDEDEALLAIVSVSAFAIVLIDQIIGKVSFEQARVNASKQSSLMHINQPLIERIAELINEFTTQFNQNRDMSTEVREIEIVGALAGYLSKAAPDLEIRDEVKLSSLRQGATGIGDIVLLTSSEKLLIEVKRLRGAEIGRRTREAVDQLKTYMELTDISQGIVYAYCWPNTGKVINQKSPLVANGTYILTLTTEPEKDAHKSN